MSDYLTPSQVAEKLHVSAKTISRWERQGKIQAVKTMGKHRRFDPEYIEGLIQQQPSGLNPNKMKVAVCEYLLKVNQGFVAESNHPLVPPTAIDWLGDGIVSAILDKQKPSDG